MTTKRKPTLKQLFKAWLKYEKKSGEATKLKWDLQDLANKTTIGTELIVHGNVVYRITTSSSYANQVKYNIERIAYVKELETLE